MYSGAFVGGFWVVGTVVDGWVAVVAVVGLDTVVIFVVVVVDSAQCDKVLLF